MLPLNIAVRMHFASQVLPIPAGFNSWPQHASGAWRSSMLPHAAFIVCRSHSIFPDVTADRKLILVEL